MSCLGRAPWSGGADMRSPACLRFGGRWEIQAEILAKGLALQRDGFAPASGASARLEFGHFVIS